MPGRRRRQRPRRTRPPAGIAVDANTGDIYVGDPETERIEKYNPNGSYITQLESGIGGTPSFTLPEEYFEVGRLGVAYNGLAVDLEGDLYVANARSDGHGQIVKANVLKFAPSGTYSGLSFEISSAERSGGPQLFSVAVNGAGSVYAMITGRLMAKFAASGERLEWNQPGKGGDEATVDQLTGNVFSAVSSNDITGPRAAPGEIIVYENNARDEGVATVHTGVLGKDDPSVGLAFDTAEGRLFLVDPTTSEVAVIGAFPFPVQQAPTVIDESLAADGPSSVTVAGHLNPNLLDTTVSAEYRTDPSLAGAASVPASSADIGSGRLPVAVSAVLPGLQPDTTYYYRLVGHNSFGGGVGSTTDGATQSFTTFAPSPVPSGEGASEVTFDSALLTGMVSPGGSTSESDTRWCFEYGTAGSSEYNLGSVPLLAGNLGKGTSAVPVSFHLGGLEPGHTYRYRLVAINSVGWGSLTTRNGGVRAGGAWCGKAVQHRRIAARAGRGDGRRRWRGAELGGDLRGGRTAWRAHELRVPGRARYRLRRRGLRRSRGRLGSDAGVLELGAPEPGTTYHYRLVAISQGGTSYGADGTFTTGIFPSAELSTPVTTPLVASPQFAFPLNTTGTTGGKAKVTKPKKKKKPRRSRGKARKASRSDRPSAKRRSR